MHGSPMIERGHARPPVVEMTEEQLRARAAYFFEQACVLHQQFEQLRAQKTKNGGGGEPTLDYFEVSQLSRLCGLQLDPAAMSRALEDMDPDHTGVVSFADFEAWWKANFFSASGAATSSRASSASIGAVLALAEAQE
jgi:hypothetical protein